MNNVSLIGRLTADPKMVMSKNNDKFAFFTLAVNSGMDKTDFIQCKCFNSKITENVIEPYVKKGQQIGVNGAVHCDHVSYNNTEKEIYYISVTGLDLLGSSRKKGYE